MKKLFSLLLALALVSSMGMMLTGCTKDDSSSTGSTATGDTEASGDTAAAPTEEATATDEAVAEDDWAYIQEKGTLVIGITQYQPINYYDENGELVGFDTEFAKAVCEKLGLTPEFVEINWDTKEIELAAKNIDCIWNGMTITDERKENMDFSQAYLENKQIVVIKRDNADTFSSKESLANSTLVAEISSAGEDAIAADSILSGATYVAVDKQTDALLEVKAGTADAAVLDYILAGAMVGEGTDYSDLMIVDGLDLNVEEYGIGFRKGSTAVDKFNEAINELLADGTLSEIAATYNVSGALIGAQG